MGVCSIVSRVSLYTLVFCHLIHGVFLLNFTKPTLQEVWKTQLLEYVGDELAVEYVFIFVRHAGLVEALGAIAAFLMGDTKMCFSLMMIASLGSLIFNARDVNGVISNLDLTSDVMKFGQKVFMFYTILSFLGFTCASGKDKNEKLKRSKSLFINVALILSVFIEVGAFCHIVTDPIGAFIEIQPKMDIEMFNSIFTPVGKYVIVWYMGQLVIHFIPLAAFVVSLKPTSYAIGLSYLFHTGIAYNIFRSKVNVEATFKNAEYIDLFNEYFKIVAIIHSAVAAILVVAFVILQLGGKKKTD